MSVLVVLPSYNEAENLTNLIDSILKQGPEYSVCVVDDNSPDGTPAKVRNFISQSSDATKARVNLIVREKKDGRGGAVRRGLEWGLKESNKNFDAFIEMDCDFSHPPTDLPKGVALLKTSDVVLGSRYPDGTIQGWPLKRKILSFFANTLARTLLSWKVADYTNGFRFYSRKSAQALIQIPQKHKGYIYLSETIAYFLKNGFRIASFPILFVNRERGVSNTDFREVTSALKGVFQIAWHYRFK